MNDIEVCCKYQTENRIIIKICTMYLRNYSVMKNNILCKTTKTTVMNTPLALSYLSVHFFTYQGNTKNTHD